MQKERLFNLEAHCKNCISEDHLNILNMKFYYKMKEKNTNVCNYIRPEKFRNI